MSLEINQIYGGAKETREEKIKRLAFESAQSDVKRLEFQIFHVQTWIQSEDYEPRKRLLVALLEGYNERLVKVLERRDNSARAAGIPVPASRIVQSEIVYGYAEFHEAVSGLSSPELH